MTEQHPVVILSDAARRNALNEGIVQLAPSYEGLMRVVGVPNIEDPQPAIAFGGIQGLKQVYADPGDIYRVAIMNTGESLPLDGELPVYKLPNNGYNVSACPIPKEWTAPEISRAIFEGTHPLSNPFKIATLIGLGGAAASAAVSRVAAEVTTHPGITDTDFMLLGLAAGLIPTGAAVLLTAALTSNARRLRINHALKQQTLLPLPASTPAEPNSAYISEEAFRDATTDVRSISFNHADIVTLGKLLGNQQAAARLYGNGILLRTLQELHESNAHRSTQYNQLPMDPEPLIWRDQDAETKENLEKHTGTTVIAVDSWSEADIARSLFEKGRQFGKDLSEFPAVTFMGGGLGAVGSMVVEAIASSDNPSPRHVIAAVIGAAIGYSIDKVRIAVRRHSVRKALGRLAPIRIEYHDATT